MLECDQDMKITDQRRSKARGAKKREKCQDNERKDHDGFFFSFFFSWEKYSRQVGLEVFKEKMKGFKHLGSCGFSGKGRQSKRNLRNFK